MFSITVPQGFAEPRLMTFTGLYVTHWPTVSSEVARAPMFPLSYPIWPYAVSFNRVAANHIAHAQHISLQPL